MIRIPGTRTGGSRERQGGQTLVEFSLALIPFVFMLMAVFDLGRGIYTNNGVAQASREIARAAAVHQCVGPCTMATWSAETLEVVQAQQAMIPGFTTASVTIDCVDIANTVLVVPTGESCPADQYVRVRTSVAFSLVTPLLPIPNPFTVSSSAHVQVP